MKSSPSKKNNRSNGDRLEIFDSHGFVGIVNAQLYETFIGEKWQMEELLNRFVTESNNKHCTIWNTGIQNSVSIDFADVFTTTSFFREVSSQIRVTDKCLYLVNYVNLTMCAQFKNEKLPSDTNADLKIELENGLYDLHIRQLFDPEDYTVETYPVHCFEAVFKKAELETESEIENVIWYDA